jgi:hypothetical protein
MNLVGAESWADEMDVRVTVCDLHGVIVYMNQSAVSSFQKYGENLIGKSIYDCHNPVSCQKIKEMNQNPSVNIYTILKGEEKRMVRQFPWVENGIHKGIIELSFPVPVEVPNKKR